MPSSMVATSNGYPTYTEYHGIMRQTPDFIFIDLDLENFLPFADWSSKQLLDMALGNTLWKIKTRVWQRH